MLAFLSCLIFIGTYTHVRIKPHTGKMISYTLIFDRTEICLDFCPFKKFKVGNKINTKNLHLSLLKLQFHRAKSS